jgi:hypothetical protein
MKNTNFCWDYLKPPGDDMWRARRMAEYFPFVVENLTGQDKKLLLSRLDSLNLPEERKAFIRMVCDEKQDTD